MKVFRSSTVGAADPDPTPPASGGSGNLFVRLAKTRRDLADRLTGFFGAGEDGKMDDARFDDLRDQLLLADVGVEASERIINRLRRSASHSERSATHSERDASDHDRLVHALRAALTEILQPCEQPLVIDPAGAGPFVILMVGVNGAGKTTTVAKLAARLKRRGHSVMLAACDTFRAAAVEQLQIWGRRLEIPVIAQPQGADAAAVAHDAYGAARAGAVDVLLIDTAGRQHTREDLMAQLAKIRRVLRRLNPALPHETLLTVDAGNGCNVLSQVAHFRAAVGLDGLCVAKLDGTAKGGVVVALAEGFGLPIRFIGVGQEAEDLRPFSAAEFAAALLPDAPETADATRAAAAPAS